MFLKYMFIYYKAIIAHSTFCVECFKKIKSRNVVTPM